MKILVPVKMVPDLVEELEIDPSGSRLDTAWLRLKLNELDEHAIEQALLLKERYNAHVTVVIPNTEGAEEALFTAAAKGADRLVKLESDLEAGLDNHILAQLFTQFIRSNPVDLILTGVQAHDDLDGALGPLLAGFLDLPYVGYISGVNLPPTGEEGSVIVRKEYPGGLLAELEVKLPAVLGIQASERPPSYVAFSKIRQAMKTSSIEAMTAEIPGKEVSLRVDRMYKPESSARAEMIEGDAGQVAEKLVKIFRDLGVI